MQFQEDKEVRSLSVTARYTLTALALGLFTAIEVLVLYPPLAHAGDHPKIALLLFLGTCKFVLVVALFMHLWNDDPIYTGIFGLGMFLGVGTLVAIVGCFSYYPKPLNAVQPPPLQEIYDKRARDAGFQVDSDHAWVVVPTEAVVRAG